MKYRIEQKVFTPSLQIFATTYSFLLVCFLLICSTLFFIGCNNHEQGTRKIDNLEVPEGFTIERAVDSDLIAYPMFASFDNNGRLFVCESTGETFSTEEHLKDPPYHIRLLEDTDGNGVFDKSTIYADSIIYPMGGVFYNGSLYVASPPNLLRLTDTDGDGVADKKEVVLTGWVLNHNAAALHGPFMGPDGWLYMCDARRGFDITTKEGTELKGKSTHIWRCRPDGTGLESLCAGGFDDAIELAFMPSGETIGTITYFTNPKNGYRDALMHWVYGGVYPKPFPTIEEDHLKLTGDLMPTMDSLARIAHSGVMRYRGSVWGKEFRDNLFTAVFNTGKVVRHTVIPTGATYRTKDEPFMTASSKDIHPTDVLEDADGSLLVVITGGWFIAGCPLSVVAKTDVKGGIYRIRKVGAKKMDDPRGKQIDFKSMSPDKLIGYLGDSRPVVRDKAIDQLVKKGEVSVESLKKVLFSSNNERTRTKAVFALYRIGGQGALDGIRLALDDKSAMVRDASARVIGMAKDKSAVDKLMKIVQNDDDPSVRRQAATALGQIGDSQAIDALLKASANKLNDRFVNHAIRYALITFDNPKPLISALGNSSAEVQETALIALDQMDGSPLKSEQVVSFIQSRNIQLQHTGIWVASHHPDWGNMVTNFLKTYYAQEKTNANAGSVYDLMVNFSADQGVQTIIANQLSNKNTSIERKALFIDAIHHSKVTNLPAIWVNQLGRLLQHTPELRSKVLSVITSKNVPKLNEILGNIIQNPKTPAAFRLQALGARIISNPQLSKQEFQLVLDYLEPQNESPIRQEAAQLLVQAKLNKAQLLTLAQKQMPTIETFLIPQLVKAFENSGSGNAKIGEALVTTLQSTPDRLDNLSLDEVKKLFSTFPSSVQASAKPIMDKLQKKQASRLQKLEELQSKLTRGDVAKGRALFYGKATCYTCHSIEGKGGTLGPDLTTIGAIRSEHDILEAIMYPSASFAREHETSKVVTKSNTYIGIITGQTPGVVTIATGPVSKVQVPRSEITSIEPQDVSMMPKGLDKIMTTDELSDLIAFLTSLPNGLGQIKSSE